MGALFIRCKGGEGESWVPYFHFWGRLNCGAETAARVSMLQPIELSVGELQMYGTVDWCNMVDYLGKVKKTTDFENTVFVFKMGVVFLCCERQKRRKSKVGREILFTYQNIY